MGGDWNCAAVYAFEREARRRFEPNDPQALKMPELRGYVESVFELFGRYPDRPIRMDCGFGIAVGNCRFHYDEIVIALPEMRRRPWCAIHEAVHAITPATAHGPEFASMLIDAWDALIGWPKAELNEIAARHGVSLLYEEVA